MGTLPIEMYDYDRRLKTAFLTRETVKRIATIVSDVVKSADDFLRSIEFGTSKADPGGIQKGAKDLASLAKWALSRREPESEPLARFAKATADLAEMTKFWNRPTFLGRSEYEEKVKVVVGKIHKAKRDLAVAIRESQRMQAVK